ncbi:hypothetical protein [Isachenkonia alkalipeptolytica]|uniref:Uncharacterized protein n=1 Tax=Isachenkonia alkalipeptolytica TaxID=2565777 RepID=A0AA44BDQ8_9CLOT|nr:hypothetical protein [Isachenkonia alkalipeptolytica]NBG88197.1 hypothetical protein [Isachenkonia alkalipeptolytica]
MIIALLIFTYYSRSLQSGDLQRIENQLHNMSREISREVGRIEQQVGQIREEERWWSKGSLELERKGENLQEVSVEYQIQDYKDGEKLYFHYRPTADEHYQSVEMEEVSTGVFRAVFDLALSIEPEIRMHYSGSSPGDRGNEVQTWADQEEGGQDYLPHYVSTEYNGERRTTAEEKMHFSGMKFELYHPVHINIHHHGGSEPEYDVNIDVDQYHPSPNYQLKTLETYLLKENHKVREVEMEHHEENTYRNYRKRIPMEEEVYDEILLRFIYDNEEVFERRVKVGEGQ